MPNHQARRAKLMLCLRPSLRHYYGLNGDGKSRAQERAASMRNLRRYSVPVTINNPKQGDIEDDGL